MFVFPIKKAPQPDYSYVRFALLKISLLNLFEIYMSPRFFFNKICHNYKELLEQIPSSRYVHKLFSK